MALTEQQAAELTRINTSRHVSLISGISQRKPFPPEICTEEFVERAIETHPDAFLLIPEEHRTLERAINAIKDGTSFNQYSLDYFKPFLSDNNLLSAIFGRCPAGYLRLTEINKLPAPDKITYLSIIAAQRNNRFPDSQLLNLIPVEHFNNGDLVHFLDHLMIYDKRKRKLVKDAERLFNKDMIPFIIDHYPRLLRNMPQFMRDALTKNQLMVIIERNPMDALKIHAKNFTIELVELAVSKLETNANFSDTYEQHIRKRVTIEELQAFLDGGLYSAYFFEDAVKAELDVNPIEMYARALQFGQGKRKPCRSRIDKYFMPEMLRIYYNSIAESLDYDTKAQIIKDFEFDINLTQEVFTCPCCNTPLPPELVAKIKAS